MIKRLSLVVLFVLLSLSACPSWAETPEELDRKIKEEERRMEILERQARRQEELLKASKVRETSYLQELSKFDQERKAAEQSMSLLELQRRKVVGEISAMEKDIARLEKEIERIKAFLSERLVTIYKFGGTAELNLLLASQNVSDAMNTGYLLRRLANQDEELIGSAERETAQVRTLVAGLAAREKDLQNKKRQMANQKKKLEQAVAERNGLLKKLRENQDVYRQSLKEAEEDQRDIQAKIQAYIRAKEELARVKKPGTPEAPPLPRHGGRFQWPVSGKITSPFGVRVHPTFKTKTVHTGIDISAPHGTAVRAAGAGDVLYSGWLRGYGQIIIMDHGAGYSTVYAHLSRIIATEGQRVVAGQHIGNVGDTGVTTGAHLHFEVRVNGDAKDPLKYLGK